MRKIRAGAPLLFLLAVLSFGFAHVAFLPPWEGFDESAHYSSISQIADTGTIPWFDTARLASEVESYRTLGPMPYASAPPFEENGAITYYQFFQSANEEHLRLSRHLFDRAYPAAAFTPGAQSNWESQQPPAYYILMAAIEALISDQPMGLRLLVLRSISYVLAFTGLVIAYKANRLAFERLMPSPRMAIYGSAAWPLLLPMWFPEMGRLGNDSLSVVLMSAAWLSLVRISLGDDTRRSYLFLGIALGIGQWVKLFFLPIAFSAALFLVWREAGARMRHRYRRWLAFLTPMAAIGLPLYVRNLVETGSLAPTYDALHLDKAGGLVEGLSRHWSASEYLFSIASIVKSFIWAGTWSFGRPPLILMVPTSVLVGTVVVAYLAEVARRRDRTAVLPLIVIAALAAGLLYHSLLWLAVGGPRIFTGGWYMFVLAGPIGLVIGVGVEGIWRKAGTRLFLAGAAVLAFAFSGVAAAYQLLMYGGCAVKDGSDSTLYVPAGRTCWHAPKELYENLAVLAYPLVGVVSLSVGAVLAVAGMAMALRAEPQTGEPAAL